MHPKTTQKLLSKVVEDYDNISEEFHQTRQNNWQEFENFLKYIGEGTARARDEQGSGFASPSEVEPFKKNTQQLIDLGCGNGRFYKFIKEHRKVRYLGIDNNKKLLEKAGTNFPEARFIRGDLLKLPVEDSGADIVVAIASLHHIPSKKLRNHAVQEIHRALKNDGLLMITVWNLFQPKYKKYIWQSRIRSLLSLGKYDARDTFILWGKSGVKRYYYAFKMAELEDLLTKNSFKILEKSSGNNHTIIAQKTTKMPESVKILKVRFNKITLEEATKEAIEVAKGSKIKQICTPNPEILLAAQRNEKYLKILNKSALNIADGVGILWAAKYLKISEKNWSGTIKSLKWLFSLSTIAFYPKFCRTVLHERVTGVDLMKSICRQAAAEKLKIFLLGAGEGIAEKTAEILKKKYTDLNVAGTYRGSAKIAEERNIIQKINDSEAQILFVAFGAPKQEFWIHKNLKKFKTVKLAIGVGGSFDFISGKRKRAPRWMRKSGLEWLYRLLKEPSRIKRIYNATIKFPVAILKKSLKS